MHLYHQQKSHTSVLVKVFVFFYLITYTGNMKLLHHDSMQCMSDELNTFEVPPTQTAIEDYRTVTVSPISTVTATGPVEWLVQGSSEEHIDLRETYMELSVKCVNDQGTAAAAATDAIGPVNSPISACFSQCTVALNDVPITYAASTYAYKAIIDQHMNYDRMAKQSLLQTGQYFIDDSIGNADPKAAKPNKGLAKKAQLTPIYPKKPIVAVRADCGRTPC